MNNRKKFALFLAGLSADGLFAMWHKTNAQLDEARQSGSVCMEAVLYFDGAQIKDEMDRRKQAHQ